MSTRGVNFLHKWISNNLPETVGADIMSVAELTQKLSLMPDTSQIAGRHHLQATSPRSILLRK
ncbi:hypothetical protein B5V02_24210 [Mesorhizobium kowhaii]|uniref:DUF768 domain-containing protein n=2 Tax=Mesorhizobium kowhaii TaxID=1300272 RepID=A0A2W7BZP0_9HYPH|nr:DUF768 domain-containing protein [Mesorhizobium kowhaii]PZV36290.1 hypothetical protein B5V02_24210 [Mesorhizobium kowhaii]